ncbi:MAG: hypothetical protein ACRDRZ_16565, partial [Pseudonocardiaceae bacterium]
PPRRERPARRRSGASGTTGTSTEAGRAAAAADAAHGGAEPESDVTRAAVTAVATGPEITPAAGPQHTSNGEG